MPVVGTLTVDLIAKTASFESSMDKASGKARSTSKSIQDAFKNMDFGEGRGGLMVLDEMLGIHLPRHVTTFVSTLPGVAQAMALAFPALAVIEVGKAIDELKEKHKAMTDALHGQGELWTAINDTALKFADQTKIKMLELGIKLDDITHGPLSSLKDRLELVNAQSLDQLKGQFETLEKEAKKAFLGMEEDWFKSFLFREGGAQAGIRRVAEQFDLLMKDIKGKEKIGDMAGIGELLDKTIAKTKEVIKTDETWAGTDATPQIIAANERLLQILGDLKESYTEVAKVHARSVELTNKQGEKTGFSETQKIGGLDLSTRLADIATLKSAAVLAFTQMGQNIEVAKGKADSMFSGAELQAHLDYFGKLTKAGGSFEDKLKTAADKKIFMDKEQATASDALAGVLSKNADLQRTLSETIFKESSAQNTETEKQLMSQVVAKTRAMMAELSIGRAETDEEARMAVLQQVHAFQRIADIKTEIKQLELLRQAAIKKGQDTLGFDAAIHQAEQRRQQDIAAELIATGKLGNVFKGTMLQMAQDGRQWQTHLADTFKQTIAGMNSSLAAFVVTGQGGFRQLATGAIEEIIKIGLQWVESKLLMVALGKVAGTQEVMTQAAIAGAGGTASMAAAPFPIDLTAPAFGAAMMGNALSYIGMLSAERGAILPNRNMMVHTHPEEMILPQHISNFVVNAASNASAGGQRGGDTNHFVFAPVIHAVDGVGVDRLLKVHGDKFESHMIDRLRRRNY